MASIRPDQLTGLSLMGDNDIFIIQKNVSAVNTADRIVGKITKSQLGFAKQSDLSSYVTSANLSSTLNSYVTSSSLSSTLGSYVTSTSLSSTLTNYVLRSETGAFGGGGSSFDDSHLYPRSNPSGFLTNSDTANFVTRSETGGFGGGSFDDSHLYPRTNPSGFLTNSDTTNFVQKSETGSFLTSDDDSSFYPRSNPSGFITGIDTSDFVTRGETGAFGGGGGGGASETSFSVVNGGGVYAIDSNSDYNSNSNINPTLYLHRGLEYKFNINAPGHPFWINTVNSVGTSNAYSVGISNNGTANGTISFKVPHDAPDTLYYNCQYHSAMNGQLNILEVINTSNFVQSSETGNFLTSDDDSSLYPRSNPSGFITGVDTSDFVTRSETGGFGGESFDDSHLYPRTNPSGFITSADTFDASNVVFTTGNQTISGDKTFVDSTNFGTGNTILSVSSSSAEFSVRPTVNGTGVLIEGDATRLTNVVFTTGDQTISGEKTFVDDASFGTGASILSLSSSSAEFSVRPTVNGTGVLIEGDATKLTNVVFTTGDQTIDGGKTFTQRPSVNGTGILIQGDATKLTNVVFTTGDQTISGDKTFVDSTNFGTGSTILSVSSSSAEFSVRPTVNGTGVLIEGDATRLTNVVFTTGDQTISGEKTFVDDASFGTGASILSLSSSSAEFSVRPTVNSTGVLLSGEAGKVADPLIVNTIIATSGIFDFVSGDTGHFEDEMIVGTGEDIAIFNDTGVQFNVPLTVNSTSTFIEDATFGTGNTILSVSSSSADFSIRPTVNGTGVLLSGEASAGGGGGGDAGQDFVWFMS